ncbi:DUF2306 domain-containing protein [Pseudonocardia sp. TMWB2A]|uniref:DUF2306 domain-containing protein n=1 Tax=Pseudonocardia sp. TMWB2A TaxID=687430 RepID=UPI00307E023B
MFMATSAPSGSRRWPGQRLATFVILVLLTLYLILVAAKGLGAAFDQDDFPEPLLIKMEAMPLLFPVHMVTGALVLLMVPLTYALRRRPAHRWAGGVTAALVLVSGLTALPVALFEPVTLWSGAGFAAQAVTWLSLLGLGLYHLWKKQYRAHRYYMLLMAAVTMGAVVFRIGLALWAAFGRARDYHLVYSLDAWAGWMLPLCVMIMVLQRPKVR